MANESTAPALAPDIEIAPVETPDTPPPAPNPFEDTARAKGWKPKAEFEGDESDWVDAEEFVKREPLFNRIRNQSKEIKELKRSVEAMATHFQKSTKLAVDKAIADLKTQRKDAIEAGDVAAVEQLDQAIAEQKEIVLETKAPEVPAEIRTWMNENPWYNKDEDLHDFAVAFNENYLRKHPGELEKSLAETTKAVKRAFPEKFENTRRSDPPAVEGGATPKGGSNKYTIDRLTSEQKLVYKQLVQQHKIMSHEEYFKSLDEIGDLQ